MSDKEKKGHDDGHGHTHGHGSHSHDQADNGQFRFFASLMFFQILILILFATKCDYPNATNAQEATTDMYPMFQDVHVMIFVGFGFLMTFLRKYGYSSVGYNMMVAAVTLQWHMTVGQSLHQALEGHGGEKVQLKLSTLVQGDFAAGAILISFGGVLGRVTPTQLIWMAMFEVIFYSINEWIGAGQLKAVDMGGSIFVHTFGAYFGLACSWMMGPPKEEEEAVNSYHSDMFSMVGTIFLWMFWPSFNGALSDSTAAGSRVRIIINTVLAMSASCTTTFAVSKWFAHGGSGKFEMEHIQNATLAGGVAVGSSSDLVVGPWAAVLIGMIAGFVSCYGYLVISEKLKKCMGLHDTCGIHNLHGMPGVIGAIGGAISAGTAGKTAYGNNICQIFAGRCKGEGAAIALRTDSRGSSGGQATAQILALVVTLAMAISSGLLVGYFIKVACAPHEHEYEDRTHWDVPADYAFTGEERAPLVQKSSDVKIEMSDHQV